MRSYLDFEKPVAEIEAKVEELRALETPDSAAAIGEEIARLEAKAAQTLKDLYADLTPWQKTQVARHPERPRCLDYIGALISDFVPLAGDRKFGDDEAIVGGFGRFRGESICILGHEKGSTTEDRLKHNFGMARPEMLRPTSARCASFFTGRPPCSSVEVTSCPKLPRRTSGMPSCASSAA